MSSIAEPGRTEVATALADANAAATRRRIEAEVREQIAAEIGEYADGVAARPDFDSVLGNFEIGLRQAAIIARGDAA
jgi:hypothetical protein